MRQIIRPLILALICTFGVAVGMAKAQEVYEPQRGSVERAQIMNALRPVVEWRLGAPVEFVVQQFRSTGDRAFVMVAPQRPGGGAIDIRQMPLVRSFGEDPSYFEDVGGIEVIAFLIRAGDQWAVVDHSLGATDAWFAAEPWCTEFAALIAAYCPP